MTNEEKIKKQLQEIREMKPFKDYMHTDSYEEYIKKHPPESSSFKPGYLLLALGFALMVSFPMIEKSTIYQKTIHPKKYWQTQIATLEDDIYKTQLFIKDWENSPSEKNKISINYDALVRRLILEGKDPEEAKKIAANDIEAINMAEKKTEVQMIKVRELMLIASSKLLDDYKRQLELAKKELSKYK